MDKKSMSLDKSRFDNREKILNGSIIKTLFILAWPIMIGNTMQVVYNLADTFWLGKLGAQAVAALSIGFPIVFLLISIGGGITVAGTTLVAQYTGADDEENANLAAGQILIFVTSLAVILSIIGYIFNMNILQLMGAPKDIIYDAEAYLDILFAGIPFMFAFFIFSALLRGYGDTRTPMQMMIGSTLLNILLDPFLIFGWGFFPKLGVQGAAYATVFSRTVAGIIGIYILIKGNKGISLSKKTLKPDFKMIKKIIKIGLPSAGESSIMALGITVLMSIVSQFGTIVVAAYGIGSRILSVVIMPSQGFSRATTTMVGQNLGARKEDRAEVSAWISSAIILGILTLFGVITWIFPASIIAIFNSDPEVIEVGVSFLRIVSLSFGFLGVRIVLGGSFRGAGNTVIAMILAIIVLWILRLPLAQVLANYLNLGTNGIWWSIFLSELIGAVVAAFWFNKGSWKEAIN